MSELHGAAARRSSRVELSIVIPVYNEDANLETLHRRLVENLERLQATYEVVYVDDGSSDDSATILRTLGQEPAIRVLTLSRNFGHQAAILAGLTRARGAAVVTMDADLQDPPELIAELFHRWRDGNDIVVGQRVGRRDESVLRRAMITAYYRALQRIADQPIMVDVGDYRLLDRKVLDVILELPETEKYLRGLVSWVGFRSVAVPYVRPGRFAGCSKFGYAKLVALALSGLASSSHRPLHAIVGAGIAWVVAVLVAALCLVVLDIPVATGVVSMLILVAAGLQLVAIGIVGLYVGRVLTEARGRPSYVVAMDSHLARVAPVRAAAVSE